MRTITWVIVASLAKSFQSATIPLALFNTILILAVPHVSLSNIDASGKTASFPVLSPDIPLKQFKNASAISSLIQIYQAQGISIDLSIEISLQYSH
jgi:Uma2 family endonuclease